MQKSNTTRIAWNKGLKTPLEVREKQRQAKLKNPTRYWLGKKRPEMVGEKNPSKRPDVVSKYSGKNHYLWKKDRSLIIGRHTRNMHDPDYKQWRSAVCNRDNWKCRINDEYCNGRLETHHILRWKDYPELRYKLTNGITLCHFHHPRRREDEERLIPTFLRLVEAMRTHYRRSI